MADDEAIQVFSGLRVIDLSRWVSGEFASKLFADFGADVVKVERPGVGSLTRYWNPFAGAPPGPEASPLFLHLNTNKRSVELDLATAGGREALLALAAGADAPARPAGEAGPRA
jgi:crotonobetainyl-CoA:carnitine CoA-transferase CaiB-like acyl-CoA transferase